MPLPIAHGLLGATLVAAIHPKPARRYLVPLFIGSLLANAADLDFVLMFIFRSKAWHRGFSHSIVFALLVSLIFVLFLGMRRIREAVAYGLAFASHSILDYVTTKEGTGVELLWPFSSQKLGFGWVGLSEMPSRMTPLEIFTSLILELMLFALLLLLMIGVKKYISQDSGRTRHLNSSMQKLR
jgi:inner membrane protein